MTKEELEKEVEDMMNKISFALKDPILQMGFEVICSKLSRLEKEKCELLGLIQAKDKLIKKMKSCGNCKWCSNQCCIEDFENPISYRGCENYSKWELAE